METSIMLIFGGLLVIAAIFINGIFITTRGETVIAPDGSKRDQNAMIFYAVYKFLMKEATPEYVEYRGDQLQQLYRRLTRAQPSLMAVGRPKPSVEVSSLLFETEADMLLWEPYVRDYLEGKEIKAKFFPTQIMFYQHYTRYVFPAIVRKPTLGCIRCMPSFWGTIFFWPVMLKLLGFTWWLVPGWILFCFSLSYLCTLLYKKAS